MLINGALIGLKLTSMRTDVVAWLLGLRGSVVNMRRSFDKIGIRYNMGLSEGDENCMSYSVIFME